MSMKKCKKCKFLNDTEAMYCNNCGTYIGED